MDLLLSCTLLSVGCMAASAPETATSQGVMQGKSLTSRSGREYFAFTRIPYAKPPIGPLRFMPPVPLKEWTGVLDATRPNPACYQKSLSLTKTIVTAGQEDCLYLNVFTPKLIGVALPVMVYIHGGFFQAGMTGPATSANYFMDEDVVLVMINFRLGALGFLSFHEGPIPGNMGLKDQALALQWVKNEIGSFGGEPNLITLFGHGSGSISAQILCTIPRTKDIVKGCISQSSVVTEGFLSLDPLPSAVAFVEALGCKGPYGLNCLQSKKVEEIGVAALNANPSSIFPFGPVFEPPSEHALLTTWPYPGETTFPWIAGFTSDEGLLFTGYYEYLANPSEVQRYIFNLDTIIANTLGIQSGSYALRKIKEKFFSKGIDPILATRRVFTEAIFLYPALRALKLYSGPKYFYIFNYTGGASLLEIATGHKLNVTGVSNGDELPYFFDMTYAFTPPDWPGLDDLELSRILIKVWVTFAKTQSPGMLRYFKWDDFEHGAYLNIGNDGIVWEEFTEYEEILDFWDEIFTPNVFPINLEEAGIFFVL